MGIERAAVSAVLLAALLILSGCADGPPMGEVSGNVTIDGKPVDKGAIKFEPEDGKTPTAGGEISEGFYLVRVPVGPMKVSISAPKVVGKKPIYNTPNSPEMPITVEALPARYNEKTELRLDVKPGKIEKHYDLQSK